MKNSLINFFLFQIAWFACALGAGNNAENISLLVLVLVLTIHLFLSRHRQRDVQFLLLAAIIGALVDSTLGWFGILKFNDQWLSPLWLVGLWMAFASTIHYSLSWLNKKLILSSVFGAIAGPLSYYAGSKFGALQLGANVVICVVILAVVWAMILPLFFALSKIRPTLAIEYYKQ